MSSKLVKYKAGLPTLRQAPPDTFNARSSPRPDDPESRLDLPGVYGFISRTLALRKWIIVAVATIAGAATLLQVLTMTPVYRATTKIEIQPDLGRILPYKELSDAAEDFITTETYVQTQKEVLRSRALALRVVERLELDKNAEFSRPRRRGVLIDVPSVFFDWIKAALLPNPDGGEPGPAAYADRVVEDLAVSVMVNTRLIQVSYDSHSPELAATILNTLVEELIELEFVKRFDASAKARDFLQRQLVELRTSVDVSEASLNRYADKRKILSIDGRQEVALDKLVDLQQEATRLEAQMIAERARLQELEDASIAEFPPSLRDETILQLQDRLSSLNQQLASFSARFGTDWPEAKAVQRQIAEVTQQLATAKQRTLAEATTRYQASRELHGMLQEQLEQQKRLANKLDQDMIQYNTLKHAAETDRELYDSLSQRLKELSVATGLKSSNVRILDAAGVPSDVFYPRKPYYAVVSVLLGLGLGLAAAFLVESLDSTVRTTEDVEQALELPCLGVIPRLEESRKRQHGSNGTTQWSDAIKSFVELQESGGWEAYRSLRTAIVYSSQQPPPRSIMVSSPLAGEGRTFTVVSLGVALAQLGARIVLVDLDLRNPGIAAMLGLDNDSKGVSSFLSDGYAPDISSYIRQTSLPNLSVIPAGIVPPNPPELLGSDRMFGALETLKEGFDVVLVDTPPVLSYTDAVVLSQMVDQVIQLARGGETPKRALELGCRQLDGVRGKMLGGVINAADMRSPEYEYRPGGRRTSRRRNRRRSAGRVRE
jgi:capsular exopolysaccharide synthesis family protein